MAGRDFIIGNVTDVVDGETIRMKVDLSASGARFGCRYQDQENIQIRRLRLTDIAWITGAFTRPLVEKVLKGKKILCLIRSRKPGGNLVADVQVI